MNEVRRARVKCDIDILAAARDRIDKIRDDEDRAIRGECQHGPGSQSATDFLTEAGHILGVVVDLLQKAKATTE